MRLTPFIRPPRQVDPTRPMRAVRPMPPVRLVPSVGAIHAAVALARLTLVGALAAGSGAALAHTVWLADDGAPDHFVVEFGGHEGRVESYDPAKLGRVQTFDASGAPLQGDRAAQVTRVKDAAPVRVRAPDAALALVDFDNGFWSKGPDGRSLNRPMHEVPGAVSGTHALKYHKRILVWNEASTRAHGQPFELVPVAAVAPKAGRPVSFKVLIDGRPAAGIWLAFGEAGKLARTDRTGIATLTARSGRNSIWAGRRTPLTGDPAASELSIEYSLVFDAR